MATLLSRNFLVFPEELRDASQRSKYVFPALLVPFGQKIEKIAVKIVRKLSLSLVASLVSWIEIIKIAGASSRDRKPVVQRDRAYGQRFMAVGARLSDSGFQQFKNLLLAWSLLSMLLRSSVEIIPDPVEDQALTLQERHK